MNIPPLSSEHIFIQRIKRGERVSRRPLDFDRIPVVGSRWCTGGSWREIFVRMTLVKVANYGIDAEFHNSDFFFLLSPLTSSIAEFMMRNIVNRFLQSSMWDNSIGRERWQSRLTNILLSYRIFMWQMPVYCAAYYCNDSNIWWCCLFSQFTFNCLTKKLMQHTMRDLLNLFLFFVTLFFVCDDVNISPRRIDKKK